ncbi:flagellar basal body-associated FliL family protein [Chitinolyticbacter albus]|uniref:flagellar basal body-associated FliL family protein n=1 Tax=Chitinolyticbacter albus TaxID=2961951 RepID=UPI00210B51CA|nr:flagellar basal body-associated FliL family protein [Chitinolyticbacter albus]
MAEAKVVEPGKGKKTMTIVLIVVVVALVLVVALGVVAFLLLRSPATEQYDESSASQSEGGHKKKAKKKAEHEMPPVYEKLQTITANLSSEEEDMVVQTEIVLEVADPETQAELKNILPKVQAETIKLIRSKAPAEVRTVAGTDKLAGEIRDNINQMLHVDSKDEGVLSVNFTTFIMQ